MTFRFLSGNLEHFLLIQIGNFLTKLRERKMIEPWKINGYEKRKRTVGKIIFISFENFNFFF
jgi:hypothetical protein